MVRPGVIITGDAAVVIAGRGAGKRIPPAIKTASTVMPITTPRPIQAERVIVLDIPHSHDARKRLLAPRGARPVCIKVRLDPLYAAPSSNSPTTPRGHGRRRPQRPTATVN